VEVKQYIEQLVDKSRAAQGIFAKATQDQVDVAVREIAKTVFDNAEELARMAVEETKMGVYEDKVTKNKGKARTIWNDLKNKKSVGIIERDEAAGIIKVAQPIGVIASITPTTNPIVTPMSNAMFALKGRNSIIIAPHPRAKRCGTYTVELINKALAKYGIPENLIQIISDPTIELTNELMKAADVVVATGGAGMVKAAYSCGKPAFGVGPGNVQCILDREVDYNESVPKIIAGRIFDNGIICSGEQTVIAPKEDYDKIIQLFIQNGALYIDDPQQKEAIRKTLFVDGIMNKAIVGQSIRNIADLAGIKIPPKAKVILVEADGIGAADLLCKEKMCPVMACFRYKEFEEAVAIAQTNLNLEGKGHSTALHSNNAAHIEYAGNVLTISRLVINQPCSTGAGGSFYNGFAPTTTLGCGTWGNNSISENFTYKHMLNVSQIGYFMKNSKVPTDEEIWCQLSHPVV
jgi:succinate-semialdehyde dehydrogenase